MPLPPGARLGPYEIVAPLGTGAMGEVFRARDGRLGRDVAIKVLPPAFAARPDRLRRFAQEARAAAALSHPNVLAVFDVHTEGEVPYVVSELLEGQTLREAVMRGPLPVRRAIDVAVQIASGLAAAHQKGIVHRDVKPANIFLTSDGHAKVLDFGLARIAEPGDTDAVSTNLNDDPATTPGAVLGTVGYMAPEQVRGEVVDARADIFALGAVCYEMFSGRRAFTGETSVEVMAAIVRSDPQELPANVVPAPLERVIRRCLEKQPGQRFQSASDVAFALEAFGAGSLSDPAVILPTASTPWRRVAAALVGGLGLVVGALWLWRAGPPADPPLVVYEAKTFDRLPVMNARFMPDGQTIVYSAATQGFAPALYVVSATAEAPEPLGLSDTHLLSVSSKGELALIVNARYQGQRLYSGTLARMTLGSTPRAMLEGVREADWGPDGDSMAIVRDLGTGRDRLEFPIGTTLYEANGYLSDPRVSPDGSTVAFLAHQWRFDDRGVVMVVDRQGTVTTLTGELWSIEGLAWSADGSRLVFSGNEAGGSMMQPMSVSPSGGDRFRTVLSVPGRLIVHDIARDGRWLVVREDLALGVRARVPGSDGERELSWLGSSNARGLSADGQWMLMVDVGMRSGPTYGVVLRKTDGTQAVRLGAGSAQQLSPDGAWAAAIIASPPELVLYPTGAGSPVRLAGGHLTRLISAEWFPDNRTLLVCGAEASSVPRCYRQEMAGATPTPVTDEGELATLAPNGTTLLITRADGSFHVRSIDGGTPRALPALTPGDRVVGWSRDSQRVYVQHGSEAPAAVERIDLATGVRTVVRTLASASFGSAVSVIVADWIDDGRWYAYNYSTVPSILFAVTGASPR
ncbi:MAG: protein kinase [Acidobacteria bacterium]|nr:protein kinase [Acidobacteriota bacterium]